MSSVCIIVPCYNEATRLASEVFLTYLREAPNVHFCFVDDGSADRTSDVLEQLQARQPERIEALILPKNQGKAGAVRAGMLHCASKSFDYLGYFDADLATPLEAIGDLAEVLDKNPKIDIVLGSRIKHLGADIQRTLFRHYVGRVVATFISNILNLPVYDTQCGAKLLRSNVVNTLFTKEFLSPWLFDVELLARYMQQNGRAVLLERVVEQPLRQWIEQSDSRLSSTYMFRMWYELYRINQTYKNKNVPSFRFQVPASPPSDSADKH